jgi:hypothetical protein
MPPVAHAGGNLFCGHKKYENSKHFNRNEAIYVLYLVDKKRLEEIAV